MLSNQTLFFLSSSVSFLNILNLKKTREKQSLKSCEDKTSGAVSWRWRVGFWVAPSWMTLRKSNCFSQQQKKVISTKLLWPPALWMGGIFSPLVHWQELPAAALFTSNPIKSCIVFISEICYFRMTEIFSQLRWGAEICKYVFGSVTVTMFSWSFSQILNCLLQLWEKKKKCM